MAGRVSSLGARVRTFIANLLPETFFGRGQPRTYRSIRAPIRTSDRVRAIPDERVGNQSTSVATGSEQASLWCRASPVDEFPIAVWERLRAQVLARKGVNLLRYASNRG